MACRMDEENWTALWVGMRQLFGLWALGFLLAAMMVGPLTSVLPRLPLKAHLLFARRAIGISAFVFAVVHVLAYLIPILLRNWRELYTPGILWIAGLVLGLIAFVDMSALAFTSRDKAVVKLGG